MRMRTINEAVAHFQETDPDTSLTKTAVRRLVVSGIVPSAMIGTKYLVSLEALEDYLGGSSQTSTSQKRGDIRRVGDEV